MNTSEFARGWRILLLALAGAATTASVTLLYSLGTLVLPLQLHLRRILLRRQPPPPRLRHLCLPHRLLRRPPPRDLQGARQPGPEG